MLKDAEVWLILGIVCAAFAIAVVQIRTIQCDKHGMDYSVLARSCVLREGVK